MRLFDWLLGRERVPDNGAVPIAGIPDQPAGGGDSAAVPGAEPDRDAEPDHDGEPDHDQVKNQLLFPRARFQGDFTPENLAFDNNLQEFAQRVAFICSLENSGKITGDDAHSQIRALYKELQKSHRGLNIDEQGK